jgi:hypothetical protein
MFVTALGPGAGDDHRHNPLAVNDLSGARCWAEKIRRQGLLLNERRTSRMVELRFDLYIYGRWTRVEVSVGTFFEICLSPGRGDLPIVAALFPSFKS